MAQAGALSEAAVSLLFTLLSLGYNWLSLPMPGLARLWLLLLLLLLLEPWLATLLKPPNDACVWKGLR